jgi:hypothetical protein
MRALRSSIQRTRGELLSILSKDKDETNFCSLSDGVHHRCYVVVTSVSFYEPVERVGLMVETPIANSC